MTAALWVLAILLIVTGLLGTLLPVLPGVPVLFLGLALAAWIGDFAKVGLVTLGVLAVLTIISVIVDFLSTGLGAKRVGASRLAIIGAMLGTVVGLFFSIPGIILGPFIGALAGEFIHRRDLLQAGKVGFGTWLGLVIGVVIRVALAFAMVAIFAAAYVL